MREKEEKERQKAQKVKKRQKEGDRTIDGGGRCTNPRIRGC